MRMADCHLQIFIWQILATTTIRYNSEENENFATRTKSRDERKQHIDIEKKINKLIA